MDREYSLTVEQARRFLLLKHGLLGAKKFCGKQGAFDFVRQCGCIQFDPVDVCGKNAELTLQPRVKGFTKQMLFELLYKDRVLVDYPDKNLSIIPTEDWPYFARYREVAEQSGAQFEEMTPFLTFALSYIEENGPVSSETLPTEGRVHWHSAIHWSGNWHGKTNAARSALEQLYSAGTLVIHHKEGTRKYYDLASRHIGRNILEASDPLADGHEHKKWRVLRRIGAVGLLWNRASDAWLNIWDLAGAERTAIFDELQTEGRIIKVNIEGAKDALFCRAEDEALLQKILAGGRFTKRCELLAPLDPLMWDRKLIEALFDFSYRWEIYTPADKRQYGYYTLPVLYGDRFAGRAECVCDRKTGTLTVRGVWLERKETAAFAKVFRKCIGRFAEFNACSVIKWTPEAENVFSI